MNKETIVNKILQNAAKPSITLNEKGSFFAPSNIALCKYWGKRNTELNLPSTPSLSISLGHLGAKTSISLNQEPRDIIWVNQERINDDSSFARNLTRYLDLFRTTPSTHFTVETTVNIPIGAGLASSACGFASVVGALDQLFAWELPKRDLSILARLGSGSASRSFWQGFVEWQLGVEEEGGDSFGVPLNYPWPDLRVGLLLLNRAQKPLSSREAMQITVSTSAFYSLWPKKHQIDFNRLKSAILTRQFTELGETAESNALSMHALMLSASPPILYSEPSTIKAMQTIWDYRKQGLELYFTQDAGPNLKLLFLEKDIAWVREIFPELQVIAPFAMESVEC